MSLFSFSISHAQTNTFPTNGDVGIGTINPNVPLHVSLNGNNVTSDLTLMASFTNPSGSKGISLGYNQSSQAGIIYSENNTGIGSPLEFWTYNGGSFASRMVFAQSGNLGIGTNSPSEKLEVNGRIKAGDRIYANSSAINDLSLVQAYNSAGGASVLRSYSGTSYWDFSASQIAGGNSLFIGQGIDISVNNAAIAIMANKNVGIGTNDPKDYKLAVNGKIRAQEIKVEASPWPDYVFKSTYTLPSLREIENHIKENGHLPGIPSAAEVKANGIDLGEMNAKLLQKIEELTLYLIEMKKNNETQQRINEIQSEKINKLEETIILNKLK
ncbi:hypothetical protein [Pedobacter hiemivivus]|nr:hypothetical protein [Pedobacter hiemivivus]